jgi:hypothetical protein
MLWKNSTATIASPKAFHTVRPNSGYWSLSSKSLAVDAGLTWGIPFTPVRMARGSDTELRYAPIIPVARGLARLDADLIIWMNSRVASMGYCWESSKLNVNLRSGHIRSTTEAFKIGDASTLLKWYTASSAANESACIPGPGPFRPATVNGMNALSSPRR